MGMVIRTLYNNQGWSEPCVKPGEDSYCGYCFWADRAIRRPSREDEVCKGECWEKYICRRFRWGCTPKGNVFNRAYKGTKVFLVFPQPTGLYTIWGVTTVTSADAIPRTQGEEDEEGFAFVHFEPFSPLPEDKWVRNLTDVELVRASWRMGTFRYVSPEQESYIESLLRGYRPEKQPRTDVTLTIKIKGHIDQRLDELASLEGRGKEDLIKEALAEFINARSMH